MTACAGQRCPPSPHSSLLRPHSSLLRPHSSLLRPHSSLLRPHSSLLRPHSSLLHSSLLTPHSSLHPVIPGVSAEPKLRHSARSRGIHASHHARIDAATTRSMTACAGQRCPHPLIPHSSLLRSLLTPPRHSGSKRRTQTSSFRAQSRNPCLPSRTHRCCDYAQHDGVCRATLPPIPSFLTPTTSLLRPHSTLHTPPRHSGSKRRTQTSSFRAQSRNPCLPSRTHRCCDYAQHDGVCRATLPPIPSFLTPTPSLLTPTPSLLTPTPSLLTPHSSLLRPHSSLLTPHSYALTPHSSLLTPHSSLLTPLSGWAHQYRKPSENTCSLIQMVWSAEP